MQADLDKSSSMKYAYQTEEKKRIRFPLKERSLIVDETGPLDGGL